MVIQNLILKPGEAYFRGGELSSNCIQLKKGQRLSLDTYFNSLSYGVYAQHTRIDEIVFSCQLTGMARISLRVFDGTSESIICEKTDTGCVFLTVSISSLPQGGVLYPVIEALCNLSLLGGEYTASCEENDINLAVAICTYKRESDVLSSIEVLKKSRKYISHAYVIDNGQTLGTSVSDDLVSVLPNKNYGGSGGFTRGIMEAHDAENTHVILMDDDIAFDSEIFVRISAILRTLRDESKNAHISAAMLSKARPWYQYELGARFNGSFIESFKQGLDIRQKESLIENIKPERVEYGAWWCFALPLSDVKEFGLPFPMFIKFDDVEYGTRCCKNAPILTLNGICVHHEDFNLKYSLHLEYYTVRNHLIMLAAHGKSSAIKTAIRLLKTSAKSLFLYRYDAMPFIYKAFNDYLCGAPFLFSTNEEALNKEIMAIAPKAKPLCEIDGWDDSFRTQYEHKRRSFISKLAQILTLGGHIIPSFMLKRKTAAFPLADAKLGDSYLSKRTIQYQLGSDMGYEMNRSFFKFLKHSFKCTGLFFKILFRHGKAKKSYLDSKNTLTSYEFWKKHLDI